MTIDWAAFTPWAALAGGALIGLAAAMFILLNGRIAGISGIVGGLLNPQTGDVTWRIMFVLGMLLAPAVWLLAADMPGIQIDADYPLLIIAGLLVGISTRYGAGCTSGHGVCGISRLSPRSVIATLAFMATGFLTVFIMRHVLS
ncbi:YeeE/YedE family protein [Pseudohongiella sp. SYSU M77423]|uniref:YeeE/YedE family protein n=1 Tax=unclassified Pseudohongiella TaxID=2629611 RepID=UPI001F3C4A03|nr:MULTISPECIES: YeeE/YedE family protein [unclassified Pseudohongiella]MDH7942381.1 YeeE/YedE family protein [Pseudohongiella sp. SYSU M77423]MEC8859772.1 YeeE/YedE family protein [Pseudomonadota bacterium]